METEKNTYGLSEGVFKACEILGLKFPDEVPDSFKSSRKIFPSDYFGDDLEFEETAIKDLCLLRKWSREKFDKIYKSFTEKFITQKPLKQTKTDLNIYFCDFVLFVIKQLGAGYNDYFDFEFYDKSFDLRKTFLVEKHFVLRRTLCNDFNEMSLVNNKAKTNSFFANFLHRAWLDASTSSFGKFKLFVAKYPRFIAKPIVGFHGKDIKIIQTETEQNLRKVFVSLRDKRMLLEEIISQHEEIRAFCPDALNTIRVYTLLDVHNVAHILTATGRFGRVGSFLDNPQQGGCYVSVDPKTGVIISDAINNAHERVQAHPDTGKIFKGFQYPVWKKVRAVVKTMAKMIPKLRHIAWDIAINDKGDPVLVEANGGAAVDVQQAADSVGRLYLYQPLLDELQIYKEAQMNQLGYRVNNLRNVEATYETSEARQNFRLQFAMEKLIADCASVLDVGCRKEKSAKSFCSDNVKYFPADFKSHDKEVSRHLFLCIYCRVCETSSAIFEQHVPRRSQANFIVELSRRQGNKHKLQMAKPRHDRLHRRIFGRDNGAKQFPADCAICRRQRFLDNSLRL